MDATERLLYAIGDYCRVFGVSPRRVEIFTYEDKEGQAGFALPVPAKFYMLELQPQRQAASASPQQAPPVPPAPVDEDSGSQRRHSRCVDDILATLESKGVPMTTTRLMSELSRAGKDWSLRYVEKLLAEMVQDGTLENPADAKPRGYRLPPEPAPEEAEEAEED